MSDFTDELTDGREYAKPSKRRKVKPRKCVHPKCNAQVSGWWPEPFCRKHKQSDKAEGESHE